MAFVVMMTLSLTTKAAVAAETLTSNLDAVVANFEGYSVLHYYNFKTMARDGGETQTFTIATEPVDNLMQITTEGFSIFYVAVGRGTASTPDLRYRDASYGLYEFGSGARTLRIADLQKGMIVVIQGAQGQSYDYFAAGVVNASEAEEITEEIHAKQVGEGEEAGTADEYRYFRILENGKFDFSVNRGCYILSCAILLDTSAGESVSSPTMKMASVNGTARGIDFKPGESTLGNPCTSYYITEEDKEQGIEYPIWLKESEEIDHYEYTYKTDEEGNPILDEDGKPVVDTETPVYKLVLDQATATEIGQFGEHPYNSDEGLSIDANSDVDGDGYVTIWACTLSEETGAYSDIVELKVPVGEITLNAPTLTLVGVDGVNRVYKLGWTNNTLCGEPYLFKVEGKGADDGLYTEFEEGLGIGETVTFKENVTVTVVVHGYADGVLDFYADVAGVNMKRKNSESADHDWNFVQISEEMLNQFNGSIVGSYLEIIPNGETNDTIAHTIDEYNALEAAGGDPSGWIAVPESFGWWQPISSNRTTLNVIEGGVDRNSNGYGYVEEKTGIFHDLAISCPPNSNNNSCIFKYIGKTDPNELGELGVYFMSKPTITFSRQVAAAGEYVEIYYGTGGSNYTNTTTHQFYEVPTDGLLTVTLPSAVHVFYIDVYTYDDLPADELENAEEVYNEVVNIDEVSTKKTAIGYYSTSGAKIAGPQKGISIIKYSDGTSMKIMK